MTTTNFVHTFQADKWIPTPKWLQFIHAANFICEKAAIKRLFGTPKFEGNSEIYQEVRIDFSGRTEQRIRTGRVMWCKTVTVTATTDSASKILAEAFRQLGDSLGA